MLGARIDVVEAPIWNFKAHMLPLPDKETTTAVVERDKSSGLDKIIVKNVCVCSTRFLSVKVQ